MDKWFLSAESNSPTLKAPSINVSNNALLRDTINIPADLVGDQETVLKLLLHAKEIAKIIGKVNQAGHTCIPLALYWKHNKVKCEIALVKGKKLFDKRATEKERDWNRQKQRIMREQSAG